MSPAWMMEDLGREIAVWLAHGVWQTTAVALAAGAALWLLRHRSARVRYGVGCVALAAVVLAPSATLLLPSLAPVPASALPGDVGPGPVGSAADGALMSGPLSEARGRAWEGSEAAALTEHLPSVLVAVWLMGACVGLLRLALGWRRVERLVRSSGPAPVSWVKPWRAWPSGWGCAVP